MTCPDCNGEREVDVYFVLRADGICHPHLRLSCIRCQATGQLPDEMAEWIEAGKKLRTDRLARNMTLRAEAKRLGVSPSELSAREQGRKP